MTVEFYWHMKVCCGSGILLTVWRYAVAVEFYWQYEDMLWQWNSIDSMKVCCGSRILLTVWRYAVTVEFYWQYKGMLCQWNSIDSMKVCCGSGNVMGYSFFIDRNAGIEPLLHAGTLRTLSFLEESRSSIFPRDEPGFTSWNSCASVSREIRFGTPMSRFFGRQKLWYLWQCTVNYSCRNTYVYITTATIQPRTGRNSKGRGRWGG